MAEESDAKKEGGGLLSSPWSQPSMVPPFAKISSHIVHSSTSTTSSHYTWCSSLDDELLECQKDVPDSE